MSTVQPNDSVAVTPGSGATIATHLKDGKEHQSFVRVDEQGDIIGTNPLVYFFVPKQAPDTSAADIFFDIYNNETGKLLKLRKLCVMASLEANEAATLGLDIYLQRTSAAGSGGTAAVEDTSTLTEMALTNANSDDSLPAGVSGMIAATGGATAAGTCSVASINPDETDGVNGLIRELVAPDAPLSFPTGTGFRCIHDSDAFTEGQFMFWGVFEIQDVSA